MFSVCLRYSCHKPQNTSRVTFAQLFRYHESSEVMNMLIYKQHTPGPVSLHFLPRCCKVATLGHRLPGLSLIGWGELSACKRPVTSESLICWFIKSYCDRWHVYRLLKYTEHADTRLTLWKHVINYNLPRFFVRVLWIHKIRNDIIIMSSSRIKPGLTALQFHYDYVRNSCARPRSARVFWNFDHAPRVMHANVQLAFLLNTLLFYISRMIYYYFILPGSTIL